MRSSTRVVAGNLRSISSAGSVVGSGWVAFRTGTGTYQVRCAGTVQGVSANVIGGSAICVISSITDTSFVINTYNSSNVAIDANTTFVAAIQG